MIPCRPTPRRSTRRIEEAVARRLIEKFSDERETRTPGSAVARRFSKRGTDSDDRPATAEVGGDDTTVRVSLGDSVEQLTRAEARELRDALSDALTERREYVHTACEHREDGAYVVERRGASSSGHRKVFDSLEAVREAYRALPDEFTADDVATAGVSGGRRHMLVWHFAEDPAFDCELVARQPLTVRKSGGSDPDARATGEVGAD